MEYRVSQQDIEASKIKDKALWASIIECAELKIFNNEGSNGSYGEQSRMEIGLGCITGCKAETLDLAGAGIEELASFIGGAVKSQNPILTATPGTAVTPVSILANMLTQ